MTNPDPNSISIYCDESCHLEHDQHPVMVLGAVWCPTAERHLLARELRDVKRRHGLSPKFELKWTKVSPAKESYYLDVVRLFLEEPRLHFRALLIPDKGKLNHDRFGQTHDEWYYKMYFDLLKAIINPSQTYRVFLDVKDTRSADRVRKLHDVLANAKYDFARRIVEQIQTVRSHEVELLQLADLLIGAVSYLNRGLQANSAKLAVIHLLQKGTSYSLTRTTLLREDKFNLFRWHAEAGDK